MSYTTYQGLPPQPSLGDELSKLISDPRTQNAISSVRLADGTLVALNPQRQQCDTCKSFLADKKSLDAHKQRCHSTCRQHNLFETVSLMPDTRYLSSPPQIKIPRDIAQKALDHAIDPAYTHACCFVKDCNFPERVPSGWNNMEIMRHVIVSHTDQCLKPEERQRLLQRFNRTQRRPV